MPVTILSIINNISAVGWIVISAGFLAMMFTSIIFWQDIKRRSSMFFFLLGIIVFVWALCYAFFEGTFGGPLATAGVKALYIGAAAVPIFLFIFFYTFSVVQKELSFFTFVELFTPYVLIAGILLMFPDFIVSVSDVPGDSFGSIVFGSGFLSYALYIVLFLGASIYLLVQKFRESAGIYKVAIRRMLIAVSLAYSASVLMSLLSPLFLGTSDLFWIGHVSASILILVISIIIIKYNFWNAKVVSTEFFISIIIVTMIAEIFFASSSIDLVIKTVITMLIVFSCAFLDGSVRREIHSRDKILHLSQDIDLITRQLKILDKKKSEFLAIASHHLREPLTAIKGYSTMIIGGSYGEVPTKVKESLGKIFDSSERLITMIDDFLDISRIESGDMNYKFIDVDMKKLTLELVDEMKPAADRAHLILSAIIDEGISSNVPFIVEGDEGKLRQVLSNLIDNAIKYTPKGEVSILLSKCPTGKKVLFSISDTGIGMSDETKGKIFRKFSRAEGVNKVYTEGTGLGLYVAREVVKKHGGNIWAESKGEGHGSTFYVELNAKV